MKKYIKRGISLLLALLICMQLFFAETINIEAQTQTFETVEEAGDYLREQMQEREKTVSLLLENYQTQEDGTSAAEAVFNEAVKHTGDPRGGDYLERTCAERTYSVRAKEDGSYDITFSFKYRTSSEQEKEMDSAVEKLLSKLSLDGKTEYQKTKAIYDYMCQNITYDYEHLNDSDYDLKATAYAALINKTAVCEGFAILFYRLALEAGLDARIITGHAKGDHAWNIVRLNKKYYNLDVTWDACVSEDGDYEYFLLNQKHFSDHTRDTEYDTEAFHKAYPMAEEDYSGALKKGKVIYKGTVDYTQAYQFLKKINQARTKKGLAKMTMDKEFLEGAVTRAKEVAVLYSVQKRPDGSKNYICSKIGSNSYWCWSGEYGEFPETDNFMSENKKSIGIGCFRTESGVSWYFIMSSAEAESVSMSGSKSITVSQELEGDFYFDYGIDEEYYEDEWYITEGTTKQIKVILEDAVIEPKSFQWKSSNSSVVSVSNGKITGNSAGKAVITAQTGDYVIKMTVIVKSVGKTTISKLVSDSGGVRVSWKSVEGAKSYRIYRKRNKGAYQKVKETTALSWLDTGAKKNGATYKYKVYVVGKNSVNKRSSEQQIIYLTRIKFTKVVNKKGKKIRVKWKKNNKASGYQIQYSTDKKFKKNVKKINIKKKKTLSATIARLKKNKVYYVRVRVFKKGRNRYYSAWSNAKKVKIKK